MSARRKEKLDKVVADIEASGGTANASEFGLAAYFYTRNLSRLFRVPRALESGMVGVNAGLVTIEVAPFCGVKDSGLGSEGSSHGIAEYLVIKHVGLGGL